MAPMCNATSTVNLFSNRPALPQGHKLATSSWALGCSQQLRSMHCTKHTCCCYHLLLLLLCCCIAMCCCVPTCSHALLTAAPAHLLAARPKIFRRDLQMGQYLLGGGYSSSYLACGAVGVPRSAAENAGSSDTPPPGCQLPDFCEELEGAVTGVKRK